MADYTARSTVILNGKQAEDQLEKLNTRAAELREEMKKLRKANDMAGFDKKERELKQVNKEMAQMKKEAFSVETVLKNLSSASFKEIATAARKATNELKAMKQTDPGYAQKAAQAEMLNKKLREMGQVTRAQQSNISRFMGVAKGFLPAFGFAAITAGIMRFGREIFNLGKTIEGETIRSVTVFGDQLGYVEDQAEKVADKMGVTNREFVSMAAATADLLIPLDFTREAAAKMSTQVQSLAGALDEWTAGKYGVAEVSNILTKAMLGEMEQLKGLGIAIRQDSKEYTELVKQKEQIEGVTNAQARAMATLELLYKKSADAQSAYMLEGNKLLRFQKAVSLFFKEINEEIATGFTDSMKTTTELYVEQQKKVYSLEQSLLPLLDRYDELSTKSIPLTADEQSELNNLIAQIAQLTPGAITQMDEYGRVLGISGEAARQLVEEQKKMLLIKNADSIAEQEQALKKLNNQLEKEVNTKKVLVNSAKADVAEGYRAVGFYDERINKADAEIQRLMDLKTGRENYIKVLKGESLLPPAPPPDTTAAKSLLKIQEDLLETAKKMPETTEAEITAKNKRITQIDEEIKRLKELGTVNKKESEEVAKLSALLGASIEEQQFAINKYFAEAGDEAFEAFIAAIEKKQKEKKIDFSIVPDLPDEKEEKDPATDYAAQKYKETIDFKLALNESMYESGLIGEQQYQDQLTELTRQAENERYEIKRKNIEQIAAITDMASNFVTTLMDMELEKAGEDEEKKKEIKKKYADFGFAVTAAQIIANTAAAVMGMLKDPGGIPGVIMAALVGVTGLAQLGIANAQRQKVKSMAKGKYPLQADDGRTYNAEFAGKPRTGMYGNNPQLGIFNEVPGKPEMVIDGVTTREIRLNYPGIEEAIYAIRDGRQPKAFADGKYASTSAPGSQPSALSSQPSAGFGSDSAILAKFDELAERISKMHISVAIEDIEKGKKKFIDIQNTRGL